MTTHKYSKYCVGHRATPELCMLWLGFYYKVGKTYPWFNSYSPVWSPANAPEPPSPHCINLLRGHLTWIKQDDNL